MSPWIGPGPHDRHLDHQIVEFLAASAAAACSSAPGFPPGTRRWRRLGKHLVNRRSSRGHRRQGRSMPERAGKALRMQVSMPERQHIHFHDAQRVEIVLVPLDEAALLHRGRADGHDLVQTILASARSRRHAGTDGAESPTSSRARLHGARSRGACRVQPAPGAHASSDHSSSPAPAVPASVAGDVLGQAKHLATSRMAALRPVMDHRGGRWRRGGGHSGHRYTGSPPRAAHARNPRRYRAVRALGGDEAFEQQVDSASGSTAVTPST